jgi:hypothetical protein
MPLLSLSALLTRSMVNFTYPVNISQTSKLKRLEENSKTVLRQDIWVGNVATEFTVFYILVASIL